MVRMIPLVPSELSKITMPVCTAMASVTTCNIPMNTSEAIPCDSCANSENRNSSSRSSPPHARVWNTAMRTCERMPSGPSHRSTNTRNLSSRTPLSLSRPSSSPKPTVPVSAMRSPLSCRSATKRPWSTWLLLSTASRTPTNCCNLWSWNLSGRMLCKIRRTRWGDSSGKESRIWIAVC